MTFIDIGIDINIVEALARIGIKTPTQSRQLALAKFLMARTL